MSSNTKLNRQMEQPRSEQGKPTDGFGRRLIGEPPDSLPDYTQICPQCKTPLDQEDEGYGFAFGGGLGQYMSCPNDTCNWFVKWLDPLEQEAT